MKNYNNLIFCTEHNHVGGDLFDAPIPTKEYIDAAINAGYKKMAITGHGGFSATQTAYDYVKKINKNGIDFQLIYGLEAYIEVPPFNISEKVGHLILMAVDEIGKNLIVKLNSRPKATHYGKPVLTLDVLKNTAFNGHVIATSACVSGAPALNLLSNQVIERMIIKNEEKLKTTDDNGDFIYLSEDNSEYLKAKKDLDDILTEIERLVNLRDSADLKAKKSALAKLQRDAKKKGLNDEVIKYGEEIATINATIEKAKADLKVARAKKTELNNIYKFYKEKVDNGSDIRNKIAYDKSRLASEEIRIKKATEIAILFQNIFGKGNYYIELQNHNFPDEAYVYPILAKIAKENKIPVIAANDAHIPTKETKYITARNVAKYLRFKEIDENPWDEELYIKTPNELAEALLKILPEDVVDEAMTNLNILGERCNYVPQKVNHYPVFDKTKDSNKLLREEAYKGISWRFPNKEDWTLTYKERLEYELDIIIKMGFADYHLIVKDFLEYGRICGKIPVEKLPEVPLTIEGAKKYAEEHGYDIGFGIGHGRGSGAGSLVTYLLGITNIDPIKYNLLFERFLNPERVTMPDIDTDFAPGVREKVIKYVKNKFGYSSVIGILTENREGVKGAIRDAASYYATKIGSPKGFLSLV